MQDDPFPRAKEWGFGQLEGDFPARGRYDVECMSGMQLSGRGGV